MSNLRPSALKATLAVTMIGGYVRSRTCSPRLLSAAAPSGRSYQIGHQFAQVQVSGTYRERHRRRLGEAGSDVHLEEPHRTVGIDDQVRAGQVTQSERLVRGYRNPGALGGQLVGQFRWYDELGATGGVPRGVVVDATVRTIETTGSARGPVPVSMTGTATSAPSTKHSTSAVSP